MRRTFFTTLADLADRDQRIFLLTADIGYGVIDAFSSRHPGRFINAGVAEQNMIGVATGLAEAGFLPFCYSITPFVYLRPLEFILNGPVLHKLPVRIVGAGLDEEYGVNGPTHWGTKAMSAIVGTDPEGKVVMPSDKAQTEKWLTETYDLPRPVYYFISKNAIYQPWT